MALFKSQVLTQASGSVGGLTYSHTSSGLYMRSRAVPVNTNTTQQIVVRGAITSLIARWATTLTPVQRDGWNLWAANTPQTNALGSSFNISGQNAYIQANTARVAAGNAFYGGLMGLPLITATAAPSDFAPNDFALAEVGEVEIGNPVSNLQDFDVSFDNTRPWANGIGGALLIYMGRPQNPGRNFFNGPYRLVAAILGAVVPPVSPVTVTVPGGNIAYPFANGEKLNFKVVAIDTQGVSGGAANPPVVSSGVKTNSVLV